MQKFEELNTEFITYHTTTLLSVKQYNKYHNTADCIHVFVNNITISKTLDEEI